MMKRPPFFLFILLMYPRLAAGQPDTTFSSVFVDDQGILRWTGSEKEVSLFGVNYTGPFAYAYRALGTLGVNRKNAIDRDVAHLSRLGIDAFRIHVWDREITDRNGNMLENDHLDLLDYLLFRLQQRGIKAILTPIAWWGAGYPEPNTKTGGFSDFYDKGGLTTDLTVRTALTNYVGQFITHINPYTGKSYRDDPDILAIELFNEPNHPGTPEETTLFINTLVKALRQKGYVKPIFYNISEGYSDDHGRAVCMAEIQGVSAQWYPTGLVRGSAVPGNMLPNVDAYPLPFTSFEPCRNKARMVYEFDAADVGGSYLYPAMARSFRTAGFQWATQFAYDPVDLAQSNSEYQTHFLNLVYTPGKAISFKIAAEVFRSIPRGADFGSYPASARFGPFEVRFAEDLSTMITDTSFYYSNTTTSGPEQTEHLQHVAGVGSSPVVRYEGTGAYFLDRLADGVWRLEVFPDAVWIRDPFGRAGARDRKVEVIWNTWPMQVVLPDLGNHFTVTPADSNSSFAPAVLQNQFDIRPGVYYLTRHGKKPSEAGSGSFSSYYAPPQSLNHTVVLMDAPEEFLAGETTPLTARVVAPTLPDSVVLFYRHIGGRDWLRKYPMKRTFGYDYSVALPAERMKPGLSEYAIAVYHSGLVTTFPEETRGDPWSWDFSGSTYWQTMVVDRRSPVVLFDARRDMERITYPHNWNYVRYTTDFTGGTSADKLALQAIVQDFAPRPGHFALRSTLSEAIRIRAERTKQPSRIRVVVRSAGAEPGMVQVALTDVDGSAYGKVIPIHPEWEEIVIPLDELKSVPLDLLPMAYPGFMPYRFHNTDAASGFDIRRISGLQFSMDAGYFETNPSGGHGFEIQSVILEPIP